MKEKKLNHGLVLGLIVIFAVVFFGSLFTFQVDETEVAVVTQFGKTVKPATPGFGWKWPSPIQTVWKFDNRIRVFPGVKGELEGQKTRDDRNIIISVFVGWRVHPEHVAQFMESVGSVSGESAANTASDNLTKTIMAVKNEIIPQYELSQMINPDESKLALAEIESNIKTKLSREALKIYGIEITFVGIRQIGFPENVTQKVFDRMNAERDQKIEETLAQADAEAESIRASADRERQKEISVAQQEAKGIRAKAEADVTKSYAAFQKNAELEIFLRKLEALKNILNEQTTLVLSTKTVPFDLLSEDALKQLEDVNVVTPAEGE